MKMKRLYKFTPSLLVTAFLSILFNSCIKEDMDNCPTTIRVHFDHLPITYTVIREGLDPAKVSQMNLYWFDAKTNVLLGEQIDAAPAFGTDYYMDIPALESGEYKFIAWGNLKGDYLLNPTTPQIGVTTYDQLAVHLRENAIEEGLVKAAIAPLFYGQSAMKEIKVGESLEVRIPIVQDTYTVNLTVKGALDLNNSYQYGITDDNTYFDFNNAYIASKKVKYVAACGSPQNGALTGSVTTLRIGRERAPILSVADSNNVSDPLFSADLISMLLKIEEDYKIEIDFTNMYEFDIEITIEGSSFVVTINGWKLVYTENELFG